MEKRLILASGSATRRQLLDRLGCPYTIRPPSIDETPLDGEAPETLALRLARRKAEAVAAIEPAAIVIGSDQIAALDGQLMGKPGDYDRARQQLQACSGRLVTFHCGLCVIDGDSREYQSALASYRVRFRCLQPDQIDGYLQREQPYDCCGSFRAEGLGIALFESHDGDDPTTLLGLPMMRLVQALEHFGIDVLAGTAGETQRRL